MRASFVAAMLVTLTTPALACGQDWIQLPDDRGWLPATIDESPPWYQTYDAPVRPPAVEPWEPEWQRFVAEVAPALAPCFAPHRRREPPLFFDRYVYLGVRDGRLTGAVILGDAPADLTRCVGELPRRARRSRAPYDSGSYLQAFVYDPATGRVTAIPPEHPTRVPRRTISRPTIANATFLDRVRPRRARADLVRWVRARIDAEAPPEAGTVTVELVFGAWSELVDCEVLDGPARLREFLASHLHGQRCFVRHREATIRVRVEVSFELEVVAP